MDNVFADVFWRRAQSREQTDKWEKQREATRTASQLHADYYHLEHQVDKLLLISRALWEIVEEKHDLRENDLLAKIKEIDLRDGKIDDKLARKPQDCPNCGHRLNARNHRCIYCGNELKNEDIFES